MSTGTLDLTRHLVTHRRGTGISSCRGSPWSFWFLVSPFRLSVTTWVYWAGWSKCSTRSCKSVRLSPDRPSSGWSALYTRQEDERDRLDLDSRSKAGAETPAFVERHSTADRLMRLRSTFTEIAQLVQFENVSAALLGPARRAARWSPELALPPMPCANFDGSCANTRGGSCAPPLDTRATLCRVCGRHQLPTDSMNAIAAKSTAARLKRTVTIHRVSPMYRSARVAR